MPTVDVAPDPNNPISRLDDVDDIASTIKTIGILHALAVVERKVYLARYPQHAAAIGQARFVVIDGNRRLAAARLQGLPDVPIDRRNDLVDDGLDSKTRVIANLRRRDLSPLEEAREYQKLLAMPGETTRSVAAEVGCTHGQVSKRVKLLTLSVPVQDAIEAGGIPVSDALVLAELPDHDDQIAAFEMVRKGRKARNAVATVLAERARATSPPPDTTDLRSQAIAARDETCVKIVANLPARDDQVTLIATHAVRGAGAGHASALRLAHHWLRTAGVGPALDDPNAYAISAAQTPANLVALAYAIALAADELHCRDERRETWDVRAVDHYRRLLAAGHAATEWDAAHLPAN
ncbi:ParB N-terminal domain-containing protein [Micromonospora arborensis]|uniref:ParB/RepB/Spo0J family partition protein n=1 Tax=Micromonospora arborensis TaxID=2116518 RepID=UPI0033EB8ECA